MKSILRVFTALTLVLFSLVVLSCAAGTVPVTDTGQLATPEPSSPALGDFKITVLYDGTVTDSELRAGWGFAALVEYGGHTVLFDTGDDGPILLNNMEQMGVNPSAIEAIVISHEHDDHTRGLKTLLETGIKPTVYVPVKFSEGFKDKVRAFTDLVEVSDAVEIFPGMYTTNPLSKLMTEQALVLELDDGSVVVTGCAHPGVAEMVRRAQAVVPGKVALLIGGFHLFETSQFLLPPIVAELRQLGVEQIVPSHCTGENATGLLRDEYGEDFMEGGVGRVLTLSPETSD